MRLWPFRRRCRAQCDRDMDAALWESNRALQDAKQLRSRMDRVSERLQETKRRNHFGEAVARALRGDT